MLLIGAFRSDNGTECTNRLLTNVLEEHKIKRHSTSADSPEHNGKVERRIGTLKLVTRAFFLDFLHLFSGITVPRAALDYEATWPEAWLWALEKLN